jgi:hypothetical protein
MLSNAVSSLLQYVAHDHMSVESGRSGAVSRHVLDLTATGLLHFSKKILAGEDAGGKGRASSVSRKARESHPFRAPHRRHRGPLMPPISAPHSIHFPSPARAVY